MICRPFSGTCIGISLEEIEQKFDELWLSKVSKIFKIYLKYFKYMQLLQNLLGVMTFVQLNDSVEELRETHIWVAFL